MSYYSLKNIITFIIKTLHNELNEGKKVFENNSIIDKTNEINMFSFFYQNFFTQNKSIISQLFYAINCTKNECNVCNQKTFECKFYFLLEFQLDKILQFKLNYSNNTLNNNMITIYDCFDYNEKPNLCSINCNSCKKNCISSKSTNLMTLPEILIILLNREGEISFNIKIDFEENLNLNKYAKINDNYNYKLIGVITYVGNEKFIAYSREPIKNKWYCYNDSIVSEVNDFLNNLINSSTPYLLFYQKID